MKSAPPAKWRGMARAAIPAATADQSWSLLIGDFCGLHKYVPTLRTCYRVEGTEGRPGCVRYCEGPINRSGCGEAVGWAKERLVAVDAARREYSYEIVENNKGFGKYAATMKVLAMPDGKGCLLEWSFEADPVKGWTLEDFSSFFAVLAQVVASNLGQAASRK